MKKVLILFFAAVSCTPVKKKNQEVIQDLTTPSNEGIASLPTLTEAQIAEGWKLLFDGKSLNGWIPFKGKNNTTWEATDGMIHCKPMSQRAQGDGAQLSDLMTADEYKDFELSFDWRITVDANSGVMYRVTDTFDQPFLSGPEYQLLDDKGFPKEEDTHLTGSTFGLYATTPKILKPVGTWNNGKLVINKNRVEHWLNGQKVVEYELNSADWKKRKDASFWKDVKGYGQAPEGHIDLQDRGSEVWFKNVMIKTL